MVFSSCKESHDGSHKCLRTILRTGGKTDYPLYTKINVLSENYTQTKKLNVTICDLEGKKVEGADVKYLLYNYAEFYPIYEQKERYRG